MASYADRITHQPAHVLLGAVPLGAWVSSLVLDIVSRVAGDGSIAMLDASYRLIGIGILAALAAALLAAIDLRKRDGDELDDALLHMALNLGALVLFILNFFWRELRAFDTHAAVGQIALSLLALTLLTGSLTQRLRPNEAG